MSKASRTSGEKIATLAGSTDSLTDNRTQRRAGIGALLACVSVIAIVWCSVLPWYAAQPAMKQHLQFLDDRGIDPSAMYYTELDAMDAILDKIEGRR